MTTIITDKARGNEWLPRQVHNLLFRENAEVDDNGRMVRDYGVSADIFTAGGVGSTITYDSAGNAIMPATDPTLTRGLIQPVANAFACIVVGDWSNMESVTIGSSGNGFLFAGNGAFATFNGLYQTVAADSNVSEAADITEFGGMMLYGVKNGTLKLVTYVAGGSVVNVGNVALPNADLVLGDEVKVANGYVSGVLISYGAAVSVPQAEDLLVEYTDNLNNGVLAAPSGLSDAF